MFALMPAAVPKPLGGSPTALAPQQYLRSLVVMGYAGLAILHEVGHDA